MEYYVGSDVHRKACSFVIQAAEGAVVGQEEIPTTRAGCERLIGDHALPGGTRVALETGTVTMPSSGCCAARAAGRSAGVSAPTWDGPNC